MRRWIYTLLDTALMSVGFGPLSMMSVAKPDLIAHFNVSDEIYGLQHISYVSGLFVAFLLGETKIYKEGFKRGVGIAVSFAAIPQLLIPLVPWWHLVVFLRFIQGLSISIIPLFTAQIGDLFISERPLAKGIILSGLFWGGFLGSLSGEVLVKVIGWRNTFYVTGLAMYVMLALWWVLTQDFKIPKGEGGVKGHVWRSRFTWILGFTFFPALWVIFTLVDLAPSLGYELGWSKGQVAVVSMALNFSMAFWSIAIGLVAYLLSRGKTGPRDLFTALVKAMILSYTISFAGLIAYSKAMMDGDYLLAVISTMMLGALQGTGPTFWTSAPAAYAKEIYPRASFAIGLISNSANVIAPTITELIVTISKVAAMVELIIMPLLGIALLLILLKMRLPIES